MQQVVVDRRMARAHVDIQHGGIMQAVQHFSQSTTPDVLILETEGYRDQVLSELSQLAQFVIPNTKVILVGHVNDVILYRELIRQGLSEYLVAPVHQLQVIECLAELYNDPEAARSASSWRSLAPRVASARARLPTTSPPSLPARFNVDTIVTDLDIAFGTVGLNFNQDPAQGHGGSHQLVRPYRLQPDRAAADQVH
jgi:pilus assembly protein CpaE